jgi:hypothetical protein
MKFSASYRTRSPKKRGTAVSKTAMPLKFGNNDPARK